MIIYFQEKIYIRSFVNEIRKNWWNKLLTLCVERHFISESNIQHFKLLGKTVI